MANPMPRLAFLSLAAAVSTFAADLSGTWEITAMRFGEPETGRLKLEEKDGRYSGRYRGSQFEGVLKGDKIEFECSYKEDKETKTCGKLSVTLQANELRGEGVVFGDSIAWSAHRPAPKPAAPTKYEFVPKEFYRQFSGL